jgi:ATPase subunit of ABC transporter with duplicated ATPase domains
MNLLYMLHTKRAPRVIMTLRAQDPIPEWVTHIVRAENGQVTVGQRAQMVSKHSELGPKPNTSTSKNVDTAGKPIIEITGLNIAYHDRKVLNNINWTIREGEKWHLKGPNG